MYINKKHKKHCKHNTKHSIYKYTYCQNTRTYTHPHITNQVKTTTVQETSKWNPPLVYLCVPDDSRV